MPSSAPRAGAAEVYSANVVGYTKLTLQPGLNMLATQFVDVGYPDISVQKVDGAELLGFNWDTEDVNTTLRTWNSTQQGYVTYAWFGVTDGTDAMEDPSLNSKWVVSSWDAEAAVALVPGAGYWIETPETSSPTSVIVSGEVVTSNTYSVVVGPGLNLIANPFPIKIGIQNVNGSNLPGFDWVKEDVSATIRVWNSIQQGYVTYGWFGLTDGTDAMEDSSLNSRWVVSSWDAIATKDLEVGEAFWVVLPTSATKTEITFTRPNF